MQASRRTNLQDVGGLDVLREEVAHRVGGALHLVARLLVDRGDRRGEGEGHTHGLRTAGSSGEGNNIKL